MVGELIEFDFEGNQVRSVVNDGGPWFSVRDVACVLGIQKHLDSISEFPSDEKSLQKITSKGDVQESWTVNEPGLYRMIFQSRKPEAEKFKKWVFSDVLPSIRKHGAYLTPGKLQEVSDDPSKMQDLIDDLKFENKRLENQWNQAWEMNHRQYKRINEFNRNINQDLRNACDNFTRRLKNELLRTRNPREVFVQILKIADDMNPSDMTNVMDNITRIREIAGSMVKNADKLMSNFEIGFECANKIPELWKESFENVKY